jgi:hypothetical protein
VATALDRLWPPLQLKTIASRWTTGSNSCCHQPLPLLPRSVWQRPSIVSVAAMVAGGNDGLPGRRAGRLWLRLPVAIKRGATTVHKRFCHSLTPRGLNLNQFRRRYGIAPNMRYAVASRKNTDSLVKGIRLLDEGGGKSGWGIRCSDEMVLPSVRPPLFFCVCWR